ncbi:DNA-3-methyladenine glycosidase [Enterobacteriaceae bacterium S05]|nr:DNA-3-methyladenine glycosidase [Enterobacteriaceae bacterium S05]
MPVKKGGDFSGSPSWRQPEFKSKALTVKGDYH